MMHRSRDRINLNSPIVLICGMILTRLAVMIILSETSFAASLCLLVLEVVLRSTRSLLSVAGVLYDDDDYSSISRN